MSTTGIRKVTVSLAEDLVSFADAKARERDTTRSAVFTDLLEELRQKEQDELAREGYRFYAREAEEFAESSAPAVAESWGSDGPPR